MALNISPFRPLAVPFQPQPVRPINNGDWGPPNMAQQIQQGIGSLGEIYQGAKDRAMKSEMAQRAEELRMRSAQELLQPGSQATALSAPGGPYSTTPSGGASYNPAGKMPSFAGGTGTKTMPAAPEVVAAVQKYATEAGLDPSDVLTAMSYETGGTLDPWQKGPTTKWGQHRGLIQWGEQQRADYGITQQSSVDDQVRASIKYLQDRGVQPGMGMLEIYSAINAGGVGPKYYGRSDTAAGGAPGTVADKVNNQMAGHRAKANALLTRYGGGTGGGGTDLVGNFTRAAAQAGITPDQLAKMGDTPEFLKAMREGRMKPSPNDPSIWTIDGKPVQRPDWNEVLRQIPPDAVWIAPQAARNAPAKAAPGPGTPTAQVAAGGGGTVAPVTPGAPQTVAAAAPGTVTRTPTTQAQVAGGQNQPPLFQTPTMAAATAGASGAKAPDPTATGSINPTAPVQAPNMRSLPTFAGGAPVMELPQEVAGGPQASMGPLPQPEPVQPAPRPAAAAPPQAPVVGGQGPVGSGAPNAPIQPQAPPPQAMQPRVQQAAMTQTGVAPATQSVVMGDDRLRRAMAYAIASGDQSAVAGVAKYADMMQARQFGFMQTASGDIVRTDPTRGTVETVATGAKQPRVQEVNGVLYQETPQGWVPVTSQEPEWRNATTDEVRKLGYDPGAMGGGAQINTKTGEIKFPGKAGQQINVNPGERSEAQKLGEARADQIIQTGKAADAARGTLRQVAQMRQMLNAIQTGSIQPGALTVGQIASQLGLSDDALRTMGLPDKTQQANAQVLEALSGKLVSGLLASGQFPANNFSNADRSFLVNQLPGLGQSKIANSLLLRAMELDAQRSIEKQGSWRKFRALNGGANADWDTFNDQWHQKLDTEKSDLYVTTNSQDEALKQPKGTIVRIMQPNGSVVWAQVD